MYKLKHAIHSHYFRKMWQDFPDMNSILSYNTHMCVFFCFFLTIFRITDIEVSKFTCIQQNMVDISDYNTLKKSYFLIGKNSENG